MKKVILILGFLLILFNCDRKDEDNNYPECLNTKISIVMNRPAQTPRVSLKKYNYNNKIVYAFFDLKEPDGANVEVYDENCNLICSQGNMIDGTSFDTCVDWNNATYISTVWTDPR